MRQVYAEAAKCCSVLVVVTKNPTRKGKLYPLDQKRLSWQKGSPVAGWEDVFICVRDGQGALVGEVSPPYFQSRKQDRDTTISVQGRNALRNVYGDTPGQIGNLK